MYPEDWPSSYDDGMSRYDDEENNVRVRLEERCYSVSSAVEFRKPQHVLSISQASVEC